jgi:hypothetical protein
MHDWTLVSLDIDWIQGTVVINLRNPDSKDVVIVVQGLVLVRVPKHEEWGPSVSINEISGPTRNKRGNIELSIEMQTGDEIELEGISIDMPTHY